MKQNTTLSNLFPPFCVLLMLVLLVMQFLPFWSTDSGTVSISQYLWFPSQHSDVTELLATHTDAKFPVNEIVIPTLLMLAGSVGTLVTFLFSRHGLLLPIFTLLASLGGILGCLMLPTLRLGKFWIGLLLVCILALLCGIGRILTVLQNRRTSLE